MAFVENGNEQAPKRVISMPAFVVEIGWKFPDPEEPTADKIAKSIELEGLYNQRVGLGSTALEAALAAMKSEEEDQLQGTLF